MPKFKLIGGFLDHTEPGSPSHGKRFFGEMRTPEGIVQRKGDVLHSKYDLRQTFSNKFELVDDSTPLSPGQPIPGFAQIQAELQKIEAATPLKPTVTHTPPVAATETPISAPKAPQPAEEPDEAEEAPTTPAAGPSGKDVTKQFPKALEEDYKVFKQGKTFAVYNADDMGKVAEGINRTEVDDAIAADVKKLSKA